MPCLCGDLCCPSCGPAQGNYRCPVCREWASEGCECSDEARDRAAAAQAEADAAADRHFAELLQWERDHADEIARVIREV
jgi:hypothetical protein